MCACRAEPAVTYRCYMPARVCCARRLSFRKIENGEGRYLIFMRRFIASIAPRFPGPSFFAWPRAKFGKHAECTVYICYLLLVYRLFELQGLINIAQRLLVLFYCVREFDLLNLMHSNLQILLYDTIRIYIYTNFMENPFDIFYDLVFYD